MRAKELLKKPDKNLRETYGWTKQRTAPICATPCFMSRFQALHVCLGAPGRNYPESTARHTPNIALYAAHILIQPRAWL